MSAEQPPDTAEFRFRELSLRLERETGFDSIPTIERIYEDPDRKGRFLCSFPDCKYKTLDPEQMWRHVHFGAKHGMSFGVKSPAELGAEQKPER